MAYSVTTVYPDGKSVSVDFDPRQVERDEVARQEDHVLWCWSLIREERDRLLGASDWTQLSDAPVDAMAWAKYRKQLRDLPDSITDPTRPVIWPSPPE